MTQRLEKAGDPLMYIAIATAPYHAVARPRRGGGYAVEEVTHLGLQIGKRRSKVHVGGLDARRRFQGSGSGYSISAAASCGSHCSRTCGSANSITRVVKTTSKEKDSTSQPKKRQYFINNLATPTDAHSEHIVGRTLARRGICGRHNKMHVVRRTQEPTFGACANRSRPIHAFGTDLSLAQGGVSTRAWWCAQASLEGALKATVQPWYLALRRRPLRRPPVRMGGS